MTMLRGRKLYVLIALGLWWIALFTGAGPTVYGAELADRQVLRYATDARSFPAFDPIVAVNNTSFPVQNMIFDSLVRYAPGSADIDKIEPALATEWEVDETGTIWTFRLRDDVQFNQGFGPLTSADVKFSLERAKAPDSVVASRYAGIERIDTPDPYTVVITLRERDPFFLTKVANKFGGWIVSERAVQALGEEFQRAPVGSGPFYIEEIIPGDKVILKRNEHYWRGTPILEEVEYILMPDLSTRTLALLTGEVDAIRGAVSREWAQTVSRAGMKIGHAFPGQVILMFNLKVEPFNDLRVRKAFAYALGRDEVLDFYGPYLAAPMYAAVPPGVTGSLSPDRIPPELLYERDVAKARELLREAGFPNGLTVSTVISEHPDFLTPMQIWQELLKDAGIDLQLDVVDHATYHQRIRSDDYPLIVYGGVRDPIADVWLYEWYHSESIVGLPGGITNFSYYGAVDATGDGEIDSVDDLIEAARRTLSMEEQIEAWEAAQLQLLEHLPAFPSHVVRISFAWNPKVDLGYELQASVVDALEVWETTRILR